MMSACATVLILSGGEAGSERNVRPQPPSLAAEGDKKSPVNKQKRSEQRLMIPKASQNIPHLAFAFLQPQLAQYFRANKLVLWRWRYGAGAARRNKAIRHYYTWAGHHTEEASSTRPCFIKVIIWWEARMKPSCSVRFLVRDGPSWCCRINTVTSVRRGFFSCSQLNRH